MKKPDRFILISFIVLITGYAVSGRDKSYVAATNDGGMTWGEEAVVRDDFQPYCCNNLETITLYLKLR